MRRAKYYCLSAAQLYSSERGRAPPPPPPVDDGHHMMAAVHRESAMPPPMPSGGAALHAAPSLELSVQNHPKRQHPENQGWCVPRLSLRNSAAKDAPRAPVELRTARSPQCKCCHGRSLAGSKSRGICTKTGSADGFTWLMGKYTVRLVTPYMRAAC